MELLSQGNSREKRLRKFCYRFGETCNKMQGVNVQKVVWLLLTIFNSSENEDRKASFP